MFSEVLTSLQPKSKGTITSWAGKEAPVLLGKHQLRLMHGA